MAASIQIPTTFTAKDKFTGLVKKMGMGVKRFSKQTGAAVNRLDRKINNSFQKINRVGALVGGLALGSLFSLAVQGNIEFNDSLASVSAITGATGDELADLEKKAMQTANSTKKSGAEVLKAYELVGSAKPELLENIDALDGVTRSVITLSKASRMDLEKSALALTDVMNQFNLEGKESGKVIDILAAGAKFGAAAIPKISEAIVQFGSSAKLSNVSLIESVAAIEVFAAKGKKGAEAGTKMRNVLTTLATAKSLPPKALEQLEKFKVNLDVVSDKSLPLNQRLLEMSKIVDDTTAISAVFGKENKDAGAILLNNIGLLDDLTKKLTEKGVAETQAAINSNTLAYSIGWLKDSFLNATVATNSNNKSLEFLNNRIFDVGNNMGTIISAVLILGGLFLAFKAVVLGLSVANFIYSVALGFSAARTGALTVATARNLVALKAYKVATTLAAIGTAIWAKVQVIFNAIMSANLISLVIIAIAALVALVIWATTKYDEWGAAVLLLLGPFGMIINIFMAFRRHWDSVVDAFKTDGILAGLKRIGAVLLDSLLYPVKQLLGLIAKIPFMEGIAGGLSKKIEGIRADLGVEDPLPSTAQKSNENVSKSITEKNSNVTLGIVDKGGNSEILQNDDEIPIKMGSTSFAF